jgi:hypothetical protein
METRSITLDEFNAEFPDAGLVVLPSNVFALGFKEGNWIMYNEPISTPEWYKNSLVPYLKEKVHPALGSTAYYLVACFHDGYGERMPPPESPEYYMAWKYKFKGAIELAEPNPQRYPLLHNKKYVLCFSKRVLDPLSIAVPDPFYLDGKTEKKVGEADAARIPWEQKKGRCVWKGASWYGGTNSSRERFCLLHRQGAFPLVDYPPNQLSIQEQVAYKYILDINGWTTTWDGTPWKLASGSVMLKVDGDWEQWYYPMMKPNIHYIPVKRDLSDLNEQIEWCIAHDAEAATIAAAGEKFIREMMRPEVVLEHAVKNIRRAI